MEGRCVFLSLLIFTVCSTQVGGFMFLGHSEGDSCRGSDGEVGTCSESCGTTQTNPPKCGIKNSKFLVCCKKVSIKNPSPVVDISPPRSTFTCGVNTRNEFKVSFSYHDGEMFHVDGEDFSPVKFFNETRKLENGTEVVVELGVGAVGSTRADLNAWPWMALLGERDGNSINWFCGGVLINEEWVLSAYHCTFFNKVDVVRLGEHNYRDDDDGAKHVDFSVVESVPYPEFSHPQAYHDLILLKLSPKVPLQKLISPVCLPWGGESQSDITGHNATLTGYGDTQFGGVPTSYLQEVNLTVFTSRQCDDNYSNLPHYPTTWPRGIGQETMCAGDPNGGRDACQGDSGGPLVSQDSSKRFVLAGIVSRGYGCGHKDYPGLYANIRHRPYLAWVKKVAFAS